MPQFEIKDTDPTAATERVRARTGEEAARRHLGLVEGADVEIESGEAFDTLEGWREVKVDGVTRALIRSFHRMKFRRA